MRDFRGGNRSDHGRPFGRKSQFGNRFDNSRPTVMHDAVCSNCGKDCQVPFRPTGEKPVLCRDCFRKAGGGQDRHEERSFQRPAFQQNRPQNVPQNAPQNAPQNNQLKEQIDALTVKVDKILSILEAAVSTGTTHDHDHNHEHEHEHEAVAVSEEAAMPAASVKDSGEPKEVVEAEAVESKPKKKRAPKKSPIKK